MLEKLSLQKEVRHREASLLRRKKTARVCSEWGARGAAG
jgi:hypothetical protein